MLRRKAEDEREEPLHIQLLKALLLANKAGIDVTREQLAIQRRIKAIRNKAAQRTA